MSVTCDYLVLGAGAQGLAFTDALLNEMRGARVVIVDGRSSPGGMWNDTYAFAKLDQPSIFFGCSSSVRLEGTRPECGGELSERASRSEVLTYFRKCMTHLVKNRSVRYFPSYSAEVVKAGLSETQVRLTSTLIAGKTIDVTVRKKVVDAGYGSVPVPLSSRPFPFEADAAVKIVRPRELTFPGTAYRPMYVVIGAGKTGFDTVLWLLSRQVPAENVRWVVPRDSWYFVAEEMEQERYHDSCMVFNRCAATAESAEDIYFKLEKAGKFCRIDEQRLPEVFHCIHMSRTDLASLRAVPAIRLGRVQKVTTDRLLLERGSAAIPEGALCIDCTGNGRNRVQQVVPIFSASTIKLQRVAEFSVGAGEMSAPFCAAALGLLEAMYPGNAHTKNGLCTPAPFPDHYNDWIKYQLAFKQKHDAVHSDRRLCTFLLSHPSSRFHRMPVEQMRRVKVNYEQFPGALANLERITPSVGFSRLQGKPVTPACGAPTSEDDGTKGASCKSEVDAIKEKLALLLAEQGQLRKRVLSVQAENDKLKESVTDAEAKQQRAEAYLEFFEGEEHPAHRMQQLRKKVQMFQTGKPLSTLTRKQSDTCFGTMHAENIM